MKKNRKKSASKLIAAGVMLTDILATFFTLYLCWLSIKLDYTGSLPYLTALIGALQAATAVVLNAYFNKSKAKNTSGGVVYEAAMKKINADQDCD